MDKFCSQCGAELRPTEIEDGRIRPACPVCGWIAWGSFSLAVGGLVVVDDCVLLIQRNQEPGRGNWTLPGGFVQVDETPDVAAVREVREETGLQTRAVGLLALWHTPGGEAASTYMIFGLEPAGPLEDLRAEGEGVEIQQARFVPRGELEVFLPMGPLSQWTASHWTPEEAALRLVGDTGLKVRQQNPRTVLFGPGGEREGREGERE